MSAPSVVVFDCGSGNVHSVVRAFEAAGATVKLTGNHDDALNADGLVVPGVGAFASVMTKLRDAGGDHLIDQRLAGGRPVLGVCVGMQIMFSEGVERGTLAPGLGQWAGTVKELDAPVVPHMGWNRVEPPADSLLFRGIENERFYFVHSYAAAEWSLDVIPPFRNALVTWATHGSRFIAAVENGPLSATQFHPEKSGKAGIQLLSNWLDTL